MENTMTDNKWLTPCQKRREKRDNAIVDRFNSAWHKFPKASTFHIMTVIADDLELSLTTVRNVLLAHNVYRRRPAVAQ